jgi:nicotinate-nucleotide adenylyltransferase
MEKRRIGLFGGSFNPPTKAHLYVAEQLIERGIVDDVQFVPAYVSYHHKEYEASCTDRLSMLSLMVDESKYKQNLSVNAFEMIHKMQSSTYDFVTRFCDEGADSTNKYYFIVGGDNARKVPNFINGEELIKSIPFIVVNRGYENIESIEWCNNDPHITVNIGDVLPFCSSTQIRNAIHNIEENGLPKRFFNCCSLHVFAYILNSELYMEKSDENS